jgi:hypothetical protein
MAAKNPYIHDNTDDEISHQNFINAYLGFKGADAVSLEQGDRIERKATAHQPDATDNRQQLVDALPQQHK